MIIIFDVVLNITLVSDETIFKLVSKISVVSVVNDEIIFHIVPECGMCCKTIKNIAKKRS